MNVIINPSLPSGEIRAISSKSVAHRILICAAFADAPTRILCDDTNEDINATARCLCALGAKIVYEKPYFEVSPINTPKDGAELDCGESGSTMRFLLPVVAALGISASFKMSGRLPSRPLSPLYEELISHGAVLSPKGSNPLTVSGGIFGTSYKLRGDVSSQYISGLLFALTVSGKGGSLTIEGKMESAPYVEMTVDALSTFGVAAEKTADGYRIPENSQLHSPEAVTVEGDWSNAAFPLCMGAAGEKAVTVTGLNPLSRQGDKQILSVLKSFGANVKADENGVTVCGGKLRGIDLDASQIPDTVPVVATVAAIAEGTTKIYGASRLRLKESDRLAAIRRSLGALGADVEETEDGLIINGNPRLSGGEAESFNDHRIAMSLAVASIVCDNAVTVMGAECVAKSYPNFWDDMKNNLSLDCSMT